LPVESKYTAEDVSRLSGMPVDVLRSFWRALGFADVVDTEAAFTDLDVEALALLKSIIDLGITDLDRALHMTRVMGASMARIADALVTDALVTDVLVGPVATGSSGMPDADLGAEEFERYATNQAMAVPVTAKLLEFVWRRHAQAALQRADLLRLRSDTGGLPMLCVGFADMVGFTEISQQLSEDELATMVGRFEEIAHDTITARGGRLVKMIGDEAMFVADTALDGAHIATSLAEAYADDDMLSDVRVSLSFGGVLRQDGDYFGPTVNLASRIVGIARPGSVVVTNSFRDALLMELEVLGGSSVKGDSTGRSVAGDSDSVGGFVLKALRPRRLKGLGWIPLWVLRPPGLEVGVDDRASQRWERLSEVLKDLDEVREKGERLIAGDKGLLLAPTSDGDDRLEEASGLGDAQG
jgi:adenylate cyclase